MDVKLDPESDPKLDLKSDFKLDLIQIQGQESGKYFWVRIQGQESRTGFRAEI